MKADPPAMKPSAVSEKRRTLAVWIDHATARLVEFAHARETRCGTIHSQAESQRRAMGQSGVAPPGHVGCNLESRYQNRRRQQLDRYYDRVAAQLDGADDVLVLGPGEARLELMARLRRKSPQVAARVVSVERAGEMTDRQIAARLAAILKPAEPPAAPRSLIRQRAGLP